jgi:hypothetical protein
MDSQWTGHLPRVGAHEVVSLLNLQRTATGAAWTLTPWGQRVPD